MSTKDITDQQVVDAARRWHQTPDLPFVDELLVEATGQPRKVCERAIQRAIAHGVVECGISERTCWPTDPAVRARYGLRT